MSFYYFCPLFPFVRLCDYHSHPECQRTLKVKSNKLAGWRGFVWIRIARHFLSIGLYQHRGWKNFGTAAAASIDTLLSLIHQQLPSVCFTRERERGKVVWISIKDGHTAADRKIPEKLCGGTRKYGRGFEFRSTVKSSETLSVQQQREDVQKKMSCCVNEGRSYIQVRPRVAGRWWNVQLQDFHFLLGHDARARARFICENHFQSAQQSAKGRKTNIWAKK